GRTAHAASSSSFSSYSCVRRSRLERDGWSAAGTTIRTASRRLPLSSSCQPRRKTRSPSSHKTLIDNDTRMLVTIVYDGDFKPYLEDVLREAGPWLDQIFGVWDGFRGTKDRKSVEELVANTHFECDVFFVSNPEVTARDVAKMKRLSGAVSELLDAAT